MGGGGADVSNAPAWYQAVGITLAIASGFFIGLSLILQKKGLIDTKGDTNSKYAYLRNPFWWLGMVSMALGEVFNFLAYSFVPAILVTPLGAVSVVVGAILSVFFLKETLNFSGTMGIILSILGATLIVLHGPKSSATQTIPEFFSFVLAPGFIVYSSLCLIFLLYMVFRIGPKYGHVHPLVFITVTSIIGSFLVNAAQGLGSSIVYTLNGHWSDDNQFLKWPLYPLLVFVVITAILQVDFLNRGLRYFSTSIITPVYYVCFSTTTLVTSAVLFQGFHVDSVISAISVIIGFCVIVIGVSLLFQYNLKITKLTNARYVEDIVDVEVEEDEEQKRRDENPLKMMAETFPLPHSTSQNGHTGPGLFRSHTTNGKNGATVPRSGSHPSLGLGFLTRAIGKNGSHGQQTQSQSGGEHYVRQEENPSVAVEVGAMKEVPSGGLGIPHVTQRSVSMPETKITIDAIAVARSQGSRIEETKLLEEVP